MPADVNFKSIIMKLELYPSKENRINKIYSGELKEKEKSAIIITALFEILSKWNKKDLA